MCWLCALVPGQRETDMTLILGIDRGIRLNCKKCLILLMTYIVNPKNKKEEKVLETILKGLSIGFYTEEKEDAAILTAMEKGRKTRLLNPVEKAAFLRKLKSSK